MKQKKIIKLIITVIIIFFAGNCLACNASNLAGGKATDRSIQLVKNYIDNDQDAKAMVELNKIQKNSENNSKIFILSANLFLKKGQFDQAEKMAKKAVKISYNNPEAFIMLGNIYFEKANSLKNTPESLEFKKVYFKKAFDNFYTAYKYNPASPFAHIGLANAYYTNGQNALALDEILKAKELGINNAAALYLIGEYYYKTKEYTKSKKYLEKSILGGLTSKYKTYYLLGTIYEQENSIEKAQKSYIKALKLKPNHSESQQNLDRLIKITYKEAETFSNKQKSTADIFNNINDELNTIIQADNYLVADEFTRARELYVKVLDKNPKNINALTGMAELYYAKWMEGFDVSTNFVNDSKYLLNAKENSRIIIPLTKFMLINEDKMPETARQKLINLSVSETFDFYDLLNEVRAEFLLENFEESHEKLQKLLSFDLSNFEKFKVLKNLYYDHNYDEALILIEELKKTSYHNEELEPIINRINIKFSIADEKLNQAVNFYANKKKKLNDFSKSEDLINQTIKYFPASKKSYLHYAYLFEKQKKYKEALEKAQICYRLCKLYPDENSEINELSINKLIQSLNQKLIKSEAKK